MQKLDIVVGLFRFLARSIDNTLYPPHCLITGAVISCQSPLPLVSQDGLDRCDPAPTSIELMLTAQRHLDADELSFSSVTALWSLGPSHPAHALMMAIKYGGHQRLAVAMGRMLGHALLEQRRHPHPTQHALDLERTTCVTHVPVHRARRRERGYDQALTIASGIGSVLSLPVRTLLWRTRHTGTQTALDDAARSLNVRGAFCAVDSRMVQGESVLLVDDVFTTGATMNACASALLDAGARRVDAVSLCATI